jgi:hypothetical protein
MLLTYSSTYYLSNRYCTMESNSEHSASVDLSSRGETLDPNQPEFSVSESWRFVLTVPRPVTT